MRHKQITIFIAFAAAVAAMPPLVAQVAPAAIQGGIPLKIGLGLSDYDVDWGHTRMLGGTVWIDYAPNHIPEILSGLGIEAEARDISINHTPPQPPNFRLDTAGGGPIYTLQLRRLRDFQPYGKYLINFAGIDWDNPDPQYRHETRVVNAPGLGFEYRAARGIFVRADYEYQFWPAIALRSPGGHVLDPQGFTLGAVYDFQNIHDHN